MTPKYIVMNTNAASIEMLASRVQNLEKQLSELIGPHAEIMSVKDAAQLLGVHWRTVYNWIEIGKLKAVKTSGATYLRRSEVTASMEG